MKKKKIAPWMVLVGVAALAAAAAAGWYVSKKDIPWPGKERKYAAVYMQTGDMYFGTIDRWPGLALRDVWYLERSEEGEAGLAPFRGLFWGPGETLQLNAQQVVWWTYLDPESEMAKQLRQVAQ